MEGEPYYSREEVLSQFRLVFRNAPPGEETRRRFRCILLRLLPQHIGEKDLDALLDSFAGLPTGQRQGHAYQQGRLFEYDAFLHWLFDSNEQLFPRLSEGERGADGAAARKAATADASANARADTSDKTAPAAEAEAAAAAAAAAATAANAPSTSKTRQGPRATKARTVSEVAADGEGVKAEELWTYAKWMSNLYNDNKEGVFDIIAQGISEIGESSVASLSLEATKGLAEISPDDLETKLAGAGVWRAVSELIIHGAKRLAAGDAATAKEFSDKFLSDGFTLSYGGLDTFYGGLEKMVGSPNPNVFEAMFGEHCDREDSDLFFTTTNYGVTSTSRIEFNFIFGHKRGAVAAQTATFEELQAQIDDFRNSPAEGLPDLEREIQTHTDFVQLVQRRLDEQQEEQERKESGSKGNSNSNNNSSSSSNSNNDSSNNNSSNSANNGSSDPLWPVEQLELIKDPSHARQPQPLRRFRTEYLAVNQLLKLLGEPPLKIIEFIGARLYTGPLFVKYNSVLRAKTGIGAMVRQMQELCLSNRFVTTLHVINSALVKLSKIQPAQVVYRGISGGQLPSKFWAPNEFNVCGGVEYAFMSTTSTRSVATSYASQVGPDGGSGKRCGGVVFEMQLGMVDRGASLRWLSQYPHENEICFGPLTGLQVVGTRVEDSLLVVQARLNVNMVSMTIEQVIAKRKNVIVEMCRSLCDEALAHLVALSSSSDDGDLEQTFSRVESQVKSLFARLCNDRDDRYNDNELFKSYCMSAVAVRQTISSLAELVSSQGHVQDPLAVFQSLKMLALDPERDDPLEASSGDESGLSDLFSGQAAQAYATLLEKKYVREQLEVFTLKTTEFRAALQGCDIARRQVLIHTFSFSLKSVEQQLEGKATADEILEASGIESLLTDPDDSCRFCACRVLSTLQTASPTIANMVAALLDDEEAEVQLAAAETLSQMQEVALEILPKLLEWFRTLEEVYMAKACQALGSLGQATRSPDICAELASQLQQQTLVNVVSTICLCLGRMGEVAYPHAVDIAEKLNMEDFDDYGQDPMEVRSAALEALGTLGPEVAGPLTLAIVQKLRDPYYQVRQAACETLSKPNMEEAVQPYLENLEICLRDEHWGVRRAACGCFAMFSPEVVRPYFSSIASLLLDVEYDVLRSACKLVCDLGEAIGPAVEVAISQIQPDRRGKLLEATSILLKSTSVETIRGACLVLLKIGQVDEQTERRLLKAIEKSEQRSKEIRESESRRLLFSELPGGFGGEEEDDDERKANEQEDEEDGELRNQQEEEGERLLREVATKAIEVLCPHRAADLRAGAGAGGPRKGQKGEGNEGEEEDEEEED